MRELQNKGIAMMVRRGMRRHSGLACKCAVLLAVASLVGCEAVQAVLTSDRRPTASVRGVQLGDLSLDNAQLLFDVELTNPYSVPLPLLDVGYTLSSGGSQFVAGQADVGGTIPANSSKRITLPAAVEFAELLSVLKHVKPGAVVPYTTKMEFGAEAPVIGRIGVPLTKRGELPVPSVPQVELTSVQWESLTLSEASAVLSLRVHNTNDFPFDLQELRYDLALGGRQVASSSIAEATGFTRGGEHTLEIPISFSPSSLGLGILNLLRGDDGGYEMTGTMELTTPFGSISMPFDHSGRAAFGQSD